MGGCLILTGRDSRQGRSRLGMKALLLASGILAQGIAQGQILSVEPSFDGISDFGGVGLLQMPSARFMPDGGVAFSMGQANPYVRTAFTLQPLPWLEGVLRYTTIKNRLFGAEEFSGNQSFKDKGFDVKVRLLEESSAFPQVAVGLRDIGGTGLFSGEYLVLSRRFYDFDVTLGLGWGYTGARGHLPNPLGLLADRFKVRQNDVGEGGTFATGAYFRGERVAVFGGVAYQTSLPGLVLKLELDGNDYQSEPSSNNQKASSPINLGATYRYDDWLDLSLAFERGNTLMAQFALRADVRKGIGMPKFDAPPERLKPRDVKADIAAFNSARGQVERDALALQVEQSLTTRKYGVEGVEIEGHRATAMLSQNQFRSKPKAVGRAMRVMANALPNDIEELSYVNLESGLETQRVTILRKDLEKAVQFAGSPEEIAAHAIVEGPKIPSGEKFTANPNRYPAFNWGWNPALRQQFGGPDSSYIYQLLLRVDGEFQLSRKLSLSTDLGFNLADNLRVLNLESDSALPRVRSDIKNYLKEGKTGIARLQMDYLTNLGSSTFGRLSGGYFEEMFGGIGGELLYKPFASRWAIGMDLNRVRQRAFNQRLGFRDYEVTTGHIDWYYRLPVYNLTSQVSVGQYLAGDRGLTLTMSRHFDSGAAFGVYGTKTNVSAAQFGEGSFDKGFFISLPMDMVSLYSSRGSFGLSWRPLTRDGGQRLIVGNRLYPIVSDSNPSRTLADWSSILD